MAALSAHFALWWVVALVLWSGGDASWTAALEAPLAPILMALDADGSSLLLGCAAGGILVATVVRSLHRPRAVSVGGAHLSMLVWWLLSLHQLGVG